MRPYPAMVLHVRKLVMPQAIARNRILTWILMFQVRLRCCRSSEFFNSNQPAGKKGVTWVVKDKLQVPSSSPIVTKTMETMQHEHYNKPQGSQSGIIMATIKRMNRTGPSSSSSNVTEKKQQCDHPQFLLATILQQQHQSEL